MSIDLTSMSYAELAELKTAVEKAMGKAKTRERREALKAAEKAVAEFGFSLSELQGTTATKAPAAAKYRNPENEEQTWSGRGRKPKWVHDALANGVEMSALEV